MTYTAVLLRETDGGFSVMVPALKGCWTQGETLPEALTMAQNAIRCHLGALAEDGIEPPPDVHEIAFEWTEDTVEALTYRVQVEGVPALA